MLISFQYVTCLSSRLWVTSLADPGDGTCQIADCTLREALAAAGAGDTIDESQSSYYSKREVCRVFWRGDWECRDAESYGQYAQRQ
jgi:CSLREA domain-containing protein